MTDDADIIRRWWEGLTPRDAATLRRCNALIEVATHRQGLALARALGWSKYRREHVAGLAKILAHVKEDDNRRIMRVCGFPRWGAVTGALLKERRYERLVTTRDVEELTTALVRLVHMMGGKCNVAELGTWMQWWPKENDVKPSNQTLRCISEDYFAADVPEDEEVAAIS